MPIARVILKRRRALPFFSGHPWVFETAIDRMEGTPEPGDQVRVESFEGKLIGIGLYNPDSHIRVRLYQHGEEEPLDWDFWVHRIDCAIDHRDQLFGETPHRVACRLINSEGDSLSGLTVDRFGDWLVVQLTSRALADDRYRETLISRLIEMESPKGVWLRTEKGIREQENLQQEDGLIWGEAPDGPIEIEEHGLQLNVDIQTGQKTGYYFDQRDNRILAAEVMQGNVLDVCCYSGGFSLQLLKHGQVDHVTAVDSSAPALELLQQNATLNDITDRLTVERADGRLFLERLPEETMYDGIILDPPKLIRNRAAAKRGHKAYVEWNRLAMERLTPGGTLVTCSCSGLVSREQLYELVQQAAIKAGRRVQVFYAGSQAMDHPVQPACRESEYLKALFCRVY